MGNPTPALADLEAARLLLEKMGVDPTDLIDAPAAGSTAVAAGPTFSEYIPVVAAAVSTRTRSTYGSYWKKLEARWGDRRLDEPTPSEIAHLVSDVRQNVVQRRNSRGGRSAAEHMVAALRCLYRHAVNDGVLTQRQVPTTRVAKPRRLPSTRQALSPEALAEVTRIAGRTGNDPELDSLILRLHSETACRRAAGLGILPGDLDADQCLVQLREKGGVQRWQPVSPTLMAHLQHHVTSRPGPSSHCVLRYRDGRPITYRRYDHLWNRIGEHLPWAASQGVSTHWLRHTTLTWVERNFGYGIARAYAGHLPRGTEAQATATYIRADLSEVAAALAALTGEPHPLAPTDSTPGGPA